MGHNPPKHLQPYRVTTLRHAYEFGHRLWGFCARCGWRDWFTPGKLAEKHGKDADIREIAKGGQCPDCGRRGEEGGLYLVPDPERTLKVTPADKRWWKDTFAIALIGNMNPTDVLHFSCVTPGCRNHKKIDHDELMAIKRRYGRYQVVYELNFKLRCGKCGKKNGALRLSSNIPEACIGFVPLPGQLPDGNFPAGWDAFEWRVLGPGDRLGPEPGWSERTAETTIGAVAGDADAIGRGGTS